MELFRAGNTGNTDKKIGVTAPWLATQGGNTSNTGNFENVVIENKNNKLECVEMPELTLGALIVTCYTPNGNPIEIQARSPEHAEFLKRMNPKKTEI